MPIVIEFYIEPPWAEGRKVCSNSPGHMTNMAAMPVHNEPPHLDLGCLQIQSFSFIGVLYVNI